MFNYQQYGLIEELPAASGDTLFGSAVLILISLVMMLAPYDMVALCS